MIVVHTALSLDTPVVRMDDPATHRHADAASSQPSPDSVRDRLIVALLDRGLGAEHLCRLLLEDVVVTLDAGGDFLEANGTIGVSSHRRGSTTAPVIDVDDELRVCLEDYLNAPHQGRPFVDYRPDIGVYLFPSARTGQGLTYRTLRKHQAQRQGNQPTI